MHSDPIADMLTRIRNGCRARKARVEVPGSKLKTQIAEILKAEGFISGFREVKNAANTSAQKILEITLRYDEKGEPIIANLERVSRPGLRRYAGFDKLSPVFQGLGMTILSTSKGMMTDRDARKAKIGGEVLCKVW